MALFSRRKPAPVDDVVVEDEVEAPSLPPAPEPDENGLRRVQDHVDYLLSLVEPLRPFGMSLLEAWDQIGRAHV